MLHKELKGSLMQQKRGSSRLRKERKRRKKRKRRKRRMKRKKKMMNKLVLVKFFFLVHKVFNHPCTQLTPFKEKN